MCPTRTLAAGCGIALVAAAVLVPAGPASAAAAKVRTHHLKLTEVQTQHSEDVASGSAPSVGDSFTFSADLKKKNKKVGTDAVRCTTTHVYGGGSPTGLEVLCVAGLLLKGGSLTAQGPVKIDFSSDKPFKLAIVGGTGDYSHASGTLKVDSVSDTKSYLTLDFRTG